MVDSRSQSPMAYASSRAASPYPPPVSPSEHGLSGTEEHGEQEGDHSHKHQPPYATFSRTVGESGLLIDMDEEEDEDAEEEEVEDEGPPSSSEELSSEPPPQRSEGEWERIDEEIREMEASVEGISNYEVIDKLGEGEPGFLLFPELL